MLLRALLVDDEASHAAMEAAALRRGFGPGVDLRVHHATTLGETLDLLQQETFDLAVVDYHLAVPGAGEDAARAVADRRIPFAVISHHLTGYVFRGMPILPKEPRFEPLVEWARLWLELREEDTCG